MIARVLNAEVARVQRAARAGHITRGEYEERCRELFIRRAATVAIRRARRTPYEVWLRRLRRQQAGYRLRRARQQQ
jgi:hypothetical protein